MAQVGFEKLDCRQLLGEGENTREESQEVTGRTTGNMAASAVRAEKAPGRSQTEVAKMSLFKNFCLGHPQVE